MPERRGKIYNSPHPESVSALPSENKSVVSPKFTKSFFLSYLAG